MQPAIVFATVVIVPFVLALLSIRFGTDSRLALRSSEQIQASYGLSWDRRAASATAPTRIVLPRVEPTASHGPFPVLRLVDSIRGDSAAPFTADPHAPALEALARTLTDELWPDSVWLTGLVSPAQFEALSGGLEVERRRRHESVRAVIASDSPAIDLATPAAD